jgi:hypothetical protein
MDFLSSQKGISGLVSLNAANLTYHDFWIPSMNAETCFDNTFENLPNEPYLEAKSEYINKFKKIIDPNTFNIGIRYAGLPDFEHEQFRRFPDYLLFNIVNKYKDNKKIKFYSLQRDLADKSSLPKQVIDLEQYLDTWDNTAGIIHNLDHVISSCTSVAHLSAAMGTLTWIIVPVLPYYVWANKKELDKFGGEYTWYHKTARLFRQTKFGDWIETFEKLEISLDKLLKERNLI